MTQREVDANIEQSADVAAAETDTDSVVADYLCRHPDPWSRSELSLFMFSLLKACRNH